MLTDREMVDLIISEHSKSTEEILKKFEQIRSSIQELFNSKEEHIKELEQEKCELLGLIQGKDKAIKELEAQIEKMKCCTNCEFLFIDGNCYYDKECKNKDHWKLMR